MKELKIIGLSLLVFGTANAQDAEQAKKAIDAEQYQKAKTILKSLIASQPAEGKNYFLLGDVYLKQTEQDSAVLYFNKGKAAKEDPEYNTIGLGQIDLNNGNAAAAQAKFDAVEKELGKRDVEQLIYIGRAYINAENPDYKKAIAILSKAVTKDSKSAQAHLSLGDAYYKDRDQNKAYSSYRTAGDLDPSLLRAPLQLGVITKNTGAAFPEAIAQFDKIIAANANYGPVYRELAETYYLWAKKDSAKYNEYMKKAIQYYEKYMTMTDYSLDSRMRHADFLVLAGDYKALEAEAKEMQKLDKVNPRILRYLAYSAYENGNYAESLKAMNEFISKVEPKRIIARDYLYLGLAKMATSVGTDAAGNTVVSNQAAFDEAINDIKKAAEKDINITAEFNAIGKKLFGQKLYGPASVVFEVATTNPDSRSLYADNFYLAYSIYYAHVNLPAEAQKTNIDRLKRGDEALNKVIELEPTAMDAYFFKARVNQAMKTDEAYQVMATAYNEYIKLATAKGTPDAKVKANLIEAYSNVGSYYAVTDKVKAKEYFNNVLALDPNDSYAKEELKKL